MKRLLLFTLLCLSITSNAQLFGDISKGRKILKEIEYVIYAKHDGEMWFDIAVNYDGDVSACDYNADKSTLLNTPLKMQAANRIIMGLKFESSMKFPKFQYGMVRITFINLQNQKEPEFNEEE